MKQASNIQVAGADVRESAPPKRRCTTVSTTVKPLFEDHEEPAGQRLAGGHAGLWDQWILGLFQRMVGR